MTMMLRLTKWGISGPPRAGNKRTKGNYQFKRTRENKGVLLFAIMSLNVQLHEGVIPYLVSPYENFFFQIRQTKLTVESGK